MPSFTEGDRVRVDLPNEMVPDYEVYHGVEGAILGVLEDDAAEATGDERDSRIYRLELNSGEVVDFRWRDLRPL